MKHVVDWRSGDRLEKMMGRGLQYGGHRGGQRPPGAFAAGRVPRADAGIGLYGRKALPVVKPGTAANLLANIPLKRQIPKLRQFQVGVVLLGPVDAPA